MIAEPIGRDAIEQAAERIVGRVRRTPVVELNSGELGLEPDYPVTLKLEVLQHTGSFKPRGAFNRMLANEIPPAGVIAASGGNHAQAVAHAARELGVSAEIFVPETAPAIKVARLRSLGARIVQVGEYYDAAREAAEARARQTGALAVHAYDQAEIVAGAGTLARELESQVDALGTVLVAVGGGGLIGGTAAWLRDRARVIAVEPERCPTLHTALQAGEPVPVEVGGLASDSLAARQVGAIPFACARRWVDDAVLVSDDDLRDAQRLLWDRLRIIAEPGGAAALAALTAAAYRPTAGEAVAVLVCGANTDPGSWD